MLFIIIILFFISIILPLNLTSLLKNVRDNKSTAKNTFINIVCLFLIFFIFLQI